MESKQARKENRKASGVAEAPAELDIRAVETLRVAKVIKGGRRFAFRALVVVGDNRGRVGVGTGKARTAQDAIRKATDRARNTMTRVNLLGHTIPHEVISKHGSAVVLLKPASPGTGVIAGGGVRAVLEAAGVRDVLTKALGADNRFNNTLATFKGLLMLRSIHEEARRRNKPLAHVKPFWWRLDNEQPASN
ncbi:MAG: 30S ribosomal protein S5 [Thermoflexales bacterium]